MDINIKKVENENIEKSILQVIDTSQKTVFKCSKCKQRKAEPEFTRDGKTYKVCNDCHDKINKKKITQIGTFDKPPSTHEVIKSVVEDEMKNTKIENVTLTIDSNMSEMMKTTPIEKINELEKIAGLSLSKPEDFVNKTDDQKVEYQKLLITKISKLYENKLNPLSWMILMGANVIEKNTYLLNYAGLEVDLSGFQKELYDHKKDLDEVCLEIMTENPLMIKYINNPFVKLSLILSQCGMNVAIKNKYKKDSEGRPNNELSK